jgi:hypothetical protein
LIQLYEENKMFEELKVLKQNINEFFPENLKVQVGFSDVVKLIGCNVGAGRVSSGEWLNIVYYIYFNRVPKEDCAIFVHFTTKDGDILFQNDHYLKNYQVKEKYVPGELFIDSQYVMVPFDINYKGNVEIWMGVYYPEKNKRLKPETSLVSKNREVKVGELLLK